MDLYKKILELDSVYEGEGQQPGGFTTNDPKEAIKEIVRRMFPGVTAEISLEGPRFNCKFSDMGICAVTPGNILLTISLIASLGLLVVKPPGCCPSPSYTESSSKIFL